MFCLAFPSLLELECCSAFDWHAWWILIFLWVMPVDASVQPGDLFSSTCRFAHLHLDSSLCKCELVCLWKWLFFFCFFLSLAGENNWSQSWGDNLSFCRWMLSHGRLHLAEVVAIIKIFFYANIVSGGYEWAPMPEKKSWLVRMSQSDIWLWMPSKNEGIRFFILKSNSEFNYPHISLFTF